MITTQRELEEAIASALRKHGLLPRPATEGAMPDIYIASNGQVCIDGGTNGTYSPAAALRIAIKIIHAVYGDRVLP